MIVGAETIRRGLGGVVVGLVGTTAVLGLMLLMNGFAQPPEKPNLDDPTTLSVAPEPDPPKNPEPPPKEKTRSESSQPKSAPPPKLQSGIGSVDFEMPGFSPSNVDRAADELVGDVEASVMTAESVDQKPQPVRRVDPELPRRLVEKQIEGRVVVRALIGKEGRVERVEIVEATPADVFEQHVLEAVRQWQFQPASYEGKSVKTWIELPFEFELG